jgi:heptosyltransferase-2
MQSFTNGKKGNNPDTPGENIGIMNNPNREKILVHLPNWIGDTVLATPFLHALRSTFPEGRITLMGRKWVTDLFLHFPGIDELWTFEKNGRKISMPSLVMKIRNGRFDRGFLLPNSFRSALSFFLGKVRERIGYSLDLRGIFLNHSLEVDQEILKLHMVEYYLNLLSGFTDLSQKERILKLYPSIEEREMARRLLMDNGWDGRSDLVGINPFAHQWITKRWFPERFAEVANNLIEHRGVQCVFVSEERDRPLFEKIKGMCRMPLIDLVGKAQLPVVPALLENYRLFITNDSGLMHVAAAMDVPIVAIFGPTDWKRTSPYSQKAIVIRKDQDHSPCMQPACCRAFECMEQISVQEVLAASEKLLGH